MEDGGNSVLVAIVQGTPSSKEKSNGSVPSAIWSTPIDPYFGWIMRVTSFLLDVDPSFAFEVEHMPLDVYVNSSKWKSFGEQIEELNRQLKDLKNRNN